ncbi:hypothetical protein BDZ94DRAFT_1251337 [Collybia nuda]|uniref:Uncharacterized protein n=1 Tax=Collybia nuda TaxID=64659 RepID=A0A9P5YAJ3_9AGAR|nr:hypothetical protein BDZ94DRAFT_1251337 [Collybia nuda]
MLQLGLTFRSIHGIRCPRHLLLSRWVALSAISLGSLIWYHTGSVSRFWVTPVLPVDNRSTLVQVTYVLGGVSYYVQKNRHSLSFWY